jgi:hypothetical protein
LLFAVCNENQTTDGVEQGGQRLANEICECIAKNPSLKKISLVGNRCEYIKEYVCAYDHLNVCGRAARETDSVLRIKFELISVGLCECAYKHCMWHHNHVRNSMGMFAITLSGAYP